MKDTSTNISQSELRTPVTSVLKFVFRVNSNVHSVKSEPLSGYFVGLKMSENVSNWLSTMTET